MNEVDIVPSDDIWSLCERLRVEKLLISSEVSCLQQLHDEIYRKFLQLGLQSWNSKQHQLLLQRLVSSHSCVSQDNCCALSAQLNSAEVEEAYRRLGHHHSLFAKCLSLLFSSPLCTAELLHAVGPNQEISSDESIHAVFGLLYGNCVFPTDEKAVLETLSCLIRVQLLSHSNPRLIIRKGTAAFPRLYKLYSESLYAVKIFLTAALHDSVMLVLCQDEVFLDIDPTKSPLRFPSADRVRRFGDDPTSAQYHKKMAVHRKLIVERLVLLTHSFIKGICDAISCFPLGLIWLVQQLNSALTDIKRLSANEAGLICTDLIVTNLLCPAIINPETIGIISDTPISHIARFNLMQIGQIIQTLALSRHETPQPHFQVFISHFKDSPICGLIGSLLSRPLPSFNSIFTSILSESHRTRELFRRTYFMGSLAEVNTLVSILHSSAVSKVSSDGIRAELNELCSRLPRSFSTNVSILDLAETPVVLTSNSHVHQSTIRVSADKAHGSMLSSLPHISNRCHYPSTLLPRECFDVIVFHIDTQSDPIGLMSEEKYMESVVVEVAPKKHIGSGTLKRTRVVDTGSTVGSEVSEHTPDNASDLEEEAEDQHEVGSIPSSLEAPQEHRMLLLDDDGASTIPDNVSDDDETGLSGSPSLDGRESPLSQAPSRGLQDNHEIETSDLFAASTAAGSEMDPSQRVLPTGVPVAVRKQNAEGLEEKFGKFTVPISQQSRRDDQRSLLSDNWSTNVVPSDDEGPSFTLFQAVDVAELGNQRGRLVNRPGSLCGAGAGAEDRSDTWSLDAIASDSEADGGRERTRQRIPCVNVQPLIDASQSGDNESLRRQSSGSSFSNSRSEADSELSKEDREPNATVDSVATLSSSTPKQSSEQPGPSGIQRSTFSSPSHFSGIGSVSDTDTFCVYSSSPSNFCQGKLTLFQQGLQKVGDKVRKGMRGSSFRQIPHSSTISDLFSEWNASRRENDRNLPTTKNSQNVIRVADLHQQSADDILAKYQPIASIFANDVQVPNEVTSSASESTPSEQVLAYYSSDDLTECRAFLDAKRKLRLVLSSADNIPTMPFDGNCSGMKQENEREQLILLLRTLLAEAVSGREQGLVAHTREVMRCLQIFDNKGICKLLRTMKEEYRRRSSYLLYLQQSRVTLLRLSTYIEKLMLRTQREKTLVEECLVEVLVRFYMENKDLQMKRFLQEFVALNAQDEKTDYLLRTLVNMYTRLPTSPMWHGAPAHLIAYARKTIERVVMAQIHALAFYPNLDADRHRDELFFKSLAKLARSIHPSHPMLKIPTVLHGEAPWPSAQAEISVINAYKSARDKLSCVVRCCETISNLIAMAPNMGTAAADDVTPVLVYVIIQANPPSLLSNVQYVQGFGGPLLEGAEGYWWTQFTAAIEFVKTLL